jgi:phosphoglycolate phosphatase-like HAD superfamily hydrolase
MRPKVIILDFDGTIVDSVGIKNAAFMELFKDFPEHLDEIMAYHLSHNATIRFEKFEFIYNNILTQPYRKDIKESLSSRFSNLVFDKIVGCPLVVGALEFLEYFGKIVPLYLVSMSPREELNRILAARNLEKYFKKIYSSDFTKTTAIGDILQTEGFQPYEAVFIGDTNEDYLAAESMGIFFVGRNSGKSFQSDEITVLKDLKDAKAFIEEMC